MKVLWLCNTLFTEDSIKGTTSWLQPLAEAIHLTGGVEILNISSGNVKHAEQKHFNGIRQWIVPNDGATKYGQIASKKTCLEVASIIENENPDLVHIWGTERFWCSIYSQGFIKIKVILDIQGLLFAYTDYFYGGLSLIEIIKSINLKEILMPWRTLFYKKYIFQQRGIIEVEKLKEIKHICYPSEWVKNHLLIVNSNGRFYFKPFALREAFFKTEPWRYKDKQDSPIIFSSCSAAVSYKGIHVLIKSVEKLKKKYPNIQLRLAGKIDVGDKLLDGYSFFLKSIIKKYKLENNVIYTGSLNADEMISELTNCSVCVVPSFVETYCLAFVEAMIVGAPTVVSYAGAMPELAEHRKEALFYNSFDYVTCAAYIDELIQNEELALNISANARKRRLNENNPIDIVNNQISIYKKVIENY